MLCDECKRNPAVMYYISFVNGQTTRYDLCESCANKLGMQSIAPFSWADLFPHAVMTPIATTRCGRCGTTLAEFKRNALVGCAQCYKDLHAGIEPVLRQVQKGLAHTGRTPVGFEAAKLPGPGETTPVAPSISREDELGMKLHEAVANEDFESAAQIRDELKALRAQISNGEEAKA